MATRRNWTLFLTVTSVLIVALAFFLLFSAKETERRLRVQKELELSKKTVELAAKQIEISDILKQKAETEQALHDKLTTLETTLKDFESQNKNLAGRVETLAKENDALREELSGKERRTTELGRRLKELEVDKSDLLEMLRKVEAGQGPSAADVKTAKKSAVRETDPYARPEIDTVKLGKIVVQKESQRAARVEHIDATYGFVVVNVGWQDGLKKDAVLNIIRDNKPIGKAVVQKLKAHIAAAVILPEWTKEEIRVGDFISRH